MTRNLYEAKNGIVSFGSAYVEHEPVDVLNDEPSFTRQEFADECDINHLMARYAKTGMLPQHPGDQMMYVDNWDAPSYQEALNILRDAGLAFSQLPAAVRREFDNDPGKFVEFAEDEANIDKMREWGLAKPLDPEPAPMRVEVIAPLDEPPSSSKGASEPAK